MAASAYGASLASGQAQRNGRNRTPPSTEDRIAVLEHIGFDIHMYAVFDGHAGVGVVEYAKENLLNRIMTGITQVGKEEKATLDISPETIGRILKRVFIEFDQELYGEKQTSKIKDESGCTATVAVVTRSNVILAYIGDSPGIVFKKNRSGTLKAAIGKHIPYPESEESKRITRVGGVIRIDEHAVPRINGLMVSRAFGDFSLKFKNGSPDGSTDWTKLPITPDPSILAIQRESNMMLALCSDGLIEQYNSIKLKRDEELAKGLATILNAPYTDLNAVANAALEAHRGTTPQGDDLSLVLVDVSVAAAKGGGRRSRRRRSRRRRSRRSRRRA